MKKTTIETMISYLNGSDVDTAELMTELAAELDRLTSKARANASAREAAIPVVLAHLTDTPVTCKELFNACAGELPSDYTPAKLQYLLLHELADFVTKIDNGKSANTYTKRA